LPDGNVPVGATTTGVVVGAGATADDSVITAVDVADTSKLVVVSAACTVVSAACVVVSMTCVEVSIACAEVVVTTTGGSLAIELVVTGSGDGTLGAVVDTEPDPGVVDSPHLVPAALRVAP
jgi:hypothetical protein